MSEQVIATKRANVLVENAPAQPPVGGEAIEGFEAFERALAAFKRAHGGLWAGGEATLTPTAVCLRINAVNRSIGSDDLEIILPLAAVAEVTVEKAAITNIVAVRTYGSVVKVRCYGAARFADQIDAARTQLRH